jgi:hypothetical protein
MSLLTESTIHDERFMREMPQQELNLPFPTVQLESNAYFQIQIRPAMFAKTSKNSSIDIMVFNNITIC